MSHPPPERGSQRGDRPTLPSIRDLFPCARLSTESSGYLAHLFQAELAGMPSRGTMEPPSNNESAYLYQSNRDRPPLSSLSGPGSQATFHASTPSSGDPRMPMTHRSTFPDAHDTRYSGRYLPAQPPAQYVSPQLYAHWNPQPSTLNTQPRSSTHIYPDATNTSYRPMLSYAQSPSYGALESQHENYTENDLPSLQQRPGLPATSRYSGEGQTTPSSHRPLEPSARAFENPFNRDDPSHRTSISTSAGDNDLRTRIVQFDEDRVSGPSSRITITSSQGPDIPSSEASASTPPPSKYECSYCGKGFNRPSSLRIHLNSHTGEKPFICPIEGCGRSFSVLSNMRRHARVHAQSTLSQQEESSGEEESDRRSPSSAPMGPVEQESREDTVPASGRWPYPHQESTVSGSGSRRSTSPLPARETRPEKRVRHRPQ